MKHERAVPTRAGEERCMCGVTRNTLRSIQRHIKWANMRGKHVVPVRP